MGVLNQTPLDGVGVEFVFTWKEEGGKRNKGGRRKHLQLASARGNGPTCLKFGGCPVSV